MVGGPSVTLGYFKNQEKTDEVFKVLLSSSPVSLWMWIYIMMQNTEPSGMVFNLQKRKG